MSEEKGNEKIRPVYRAMEKAKDGSLTEVGAVWQNTGKNGTYLSLRFKDGRSVLLFPVQ